MIKCNRHKRPMHATRALLAVGAALALVSACGDDPTPPPSESKTQPTIVSTPPQNVVVGDYFRYDVMAEDPEGGPFVLKLVRGPAGAKVLVATTSLDWTASEIGNHEFEISVEDPTGLSASQSFTLAVLPRAAAVVPPPLNPQHPYLFDEAYSFLFEGPNASQQGVQPGAIKREQMAVLRGRVITRDGDAIEGVRVGVKYHPELGSTRTSSTGVFNFVVNGGGRYVVQLEKKPQYFSVERQIKTQYHTHAHVEDVVLTSPSPIVTSIQVGSSSMQVARGAVEEDIDGRRQLTILFSAGTRAHAKMGDGTMIPLPSLSVRATEFTAGERGPNAMPADLPALSAYTFAANLTVDEAESMGAEGVVFNQPLPIYVENFLRFPIGGVVPFGYYDEKTSHWKAEPNGRVIAVLAPENGMAALDTDGDGNADDAATLSALGITDVERAQLASLYSPGTSLWRVTMAHFTVGDWNWPFGLTASARPPGNDVPHPANTPPNNCTQPGSFIECDDGGLGERIPLHGTPYFLDYRSRWQPGFAPSRTLEIPLTGEELPERISQVVLELEVAGQFFRRAFRPEANLKYKFVWDGRDMFGRKVFGHVPVVGRIGYTYPLTYAEPGVWLNAFATPGRATLSGARRGAISIDSTIASSTLWRPLPLRTLQAEQPGILELGGWRLSVDHRLTRGGKLEMGDGRIERAVSAGQLTLAAGAAKADDPNAIPSRTPYGRITGIAALSDGEFIVLVCQGTLALHSIRKGEPPRELISVFASSLVLADGNEITFGRNNCQGTPADEQRPRVKVDRESRVLFFFGGYLLRYDPATGTFDRLAGNGQRAYETGSPNDLFKTAQVIDALTSPIPHPPGLAVGPADEITASQGHTIFDLIDGSWVPRAGFHPDCSILPTTEQRTECANREIEGYNDAPARSAAFSNITDIDYGPDGTLYIADYSIFGSQVRSIRPDGIVRREAGFAREDTFVSRFWDGKYEPQAASTVIFGGWIDGLAVSPAGRVYISHTPEFEPNNYATSLIHSFEPGGVLFWEIGTYADRFSTVASSDTSVSGTGGGIREVARAGCDTLAFAPNGDLLFTAGNCNAAVLRASDSSLGFGLVASPDSLSRLELDHLGRIRNQWSALTGIAELQFRDDDQGRLAEIEDVNGNVTRIVDRTDTSAAIVGPYGQRTELIFENGYLAQVKDPIDRTTKMRYQEGGLLRFFTNAKDQTTEYLFDDEGRVRELHWPNGGTKTLTFDDPPGGRKSTHTSAEGRPTTYETSESKGIFSRKVTDGNGISVTSEDTPLRYAITWPDGTVEISHIRGPRADEGLGPVVESGEIILPSGRTLRTSTKRAIVQAANAIEDHQPVEQFMQAITVGTRTTTITYVHADRMLTVMTPAGRVYTSILDEKDRVVQVRPPGVLPLNLVPDERGRLRLAKQGTRTATIGYDLLGHIHDVTDPKGQQQTFEFDAADQLRTQTLPDRQVIGLNYDPNGNLSEVTPPSRPTHEFHVKEGERKIEYLPPPPTPTEARIPHVAMLDRDHEFVSMIRPSGAESTLMRDAGGRPWILMLPGGNLTIDYYPRTNQAHSITGANGVRTEFDWDGFLLKEERTTGEVSSTVHLEYDAELRPDLETVATSDVQIDFDFDPDGLPTKAGPVTILYELPIAAPTAELLGGFRAGRTYSGHAELETLNATWNNIPQYSLVLIPDELGRISIEHEITAAGQRERRFTYYPNGGLHEVYENNTLRELYAYDDNGNRRMASIDGNTSIATFDDQDRLSTYGEWSFSYTLDGRLQTCTRGISEVWTYEYDFRGNLLSVLTPTNTIVEYVADAQNRRIARKVDGARTNAYAYWGRRLIAELDQNNQVRAHFIYGAVRHAPVAMRRDGVWYAFVLDPRGSVRQVVNTSTGEIAQSIEYDAFGRVLMDSNPGFQPFGFAGGLYDHETGLVRFGARDYDPEVGRWTAKDPILFRGGDTAFYAYAYNDPVNFIDPSGRVPVGMVPNVVIENATAAINQVTNNAFSKSELDRLAHNVIDAVNLSEVLKAQSFAQIDPYTNPIFLTPTQDKFIRDIIDELIEDAEGTGDKAIAEKAKKEYEKAKACGKVKVKKEN